VLIAALFFFFVLTALMLLRPARDALGMERGMENIRWLFIGTAIVTLAVNPMFGWSAACGGCSSSARPTDSSC
jgi:AAA family ATP:ADP antiporter